MMINPMLCKLIKAPFNDPDWLWEIKHDGARIIATTGSTRDYTLMARSGVDKTDQFPELELKTKVPAVLDGELAYFDGGKSRFKGIQHRINRTESFYLASLAYPATYMVFDILEVGGRDVQHEPLQFRNAILADILIPTSTCRQVPQEADGLKLWSRVLNSGLEGIVGKHRAGTYRQGKRDWLKVKVKQWSEFVICGYTKGTGKRAPYFGALVLGQRTVDGLRYVGSVGTGFTDEELARLNSILRVTSYWGCPFEPEPIKANWIIPYIIVRVEYAEMTNDNKLRHPRYKGLLPGV